MLELYIYIYIYIYIIIIIILGFFLLKTKKNRLIYKCDAEKKRSIVGEKQRKKNITKCKGLRKKRKEKKINMASYKRIGWL